MKKIIISIFLVLFSATCLNAAKPQLRFHDGSLKILQITDSHIMYEAPEEYAKTFARIDMMISEEKPDFIAITGDVVTGNRETRDKMWDAVLERLESYAIPYCIVFGNHDAEGDMTRPQMSSLIASQKHSLNELGANGELADVRIAVKASKGRDNMLDLYFMDSHDYPAKQGFEDRFGSYAWFTLDQVIWFRNECKASAAANGGRTVPALSFFHIPLDEYNAAWDGGKRIGTRSENVCSGKVNPGMFAAMVETGSMMGVFAGHDHDNNFIANLFGIALGYGGFSGDDTTYNHLAHGLRVIVVKEGQREFETWIHEEDGRIQHRALYKDGELTKAK